MISPRLIILRGPSGSGKSTVAQALFEQTDHKIALIDQDHYRFIFKPAGGGSKYNSDTIHKMIFGDVSIALGDGYDVILEGILSERSYGEVFERLFRIHPHENYIFYFDISLDETLKRHATRPLQQAFGEAEMRELYPAAHRSGHRFEQIIPESFSLERTVSFIKQTSGI
jgi:predicted kinase